MGAYLELKKVVYDYGAELSSPKFQFEDNPENEFFELMLVLQGQLERKQNRRQVIEKMKARMERGYWTFGSVPVGYEIIKTKEHGKLANPVEPQATRVKCLLEKWANGKLQTKADVARFANEIDIYADKRNITDEMARRVLERSLFYSGWLEYEPWDIKPLEARHRGIIEFDTHLVVQERLNGSVRPRVRLNDNPMFPLRRFVLCGVCDKPLTAGLSKGRSKSYPYYLCANRDCLYYGKSIVKQNIENELEDILKIIAPEENTISLAKAMLLEKWDIKIGQVKNKKDTIQNDVSRIDKQVSELVDRIMTTNVESAKTAYENKIETLEQQKKDFEENVGKYDPLKFDFRTALEKVSKFLEEPHKTWDTGDLRDKHRVLQMCFSEQLRYDKYNGFRTADLSLTYAILSGNKVPKFSSGGHGEN